MPYNPTDPVSTIIAGFNARIDVVEAGTPVAPPQITTPAAINSDGTPQVGELLTGVDPIGTNGSVTARRWLLGSTMLTSSQTYTPTAVGAYRFEADFTGTDGSVLVSGSTVSVAAATVIVTLGALTLSSTAFSTAGVTSVGIVGKTAGSTITATSSDGTALSVSGSTLTGTFTTAGSTNITLTETLAGATNTPRASVIAATVSATVTLGPLTLSVNTGTVGTSYTGTITGKSSGSTLALSGAGAAGLSISGTTVSGTPTTAGGVNIIETLAGATGSPRTSSGVLTVSAVAAEVWRTVSANMIGQAAGSGNSKLGGWHGFRQSYYIGSGDVKQLRISMFNWASQSGAEVLFDTPLIFPSLYVVANGVAVRATQGGSNTITIGASANKVALDPMSPSQFGLTKFDRGSLVLMRGVCYRDGVITSVPTSQTIQVVSDATNNEVLWFDGALGAPTNMDAVTGAFTLPSYTAASGSIDATTATISVGATNPLPSVGALIVVAGATPTGYNGNKTITAVDATARTFSYTVAAGLAAPTGTIVYSAAKFSQAVGYRPVLEGKFVTGDPPTIFIGGDSIDVGLNQPANTGGPLGIGRNTQALHDVGATTNFTAYMSCAVGGSTVDQFTGANVLTHPWMALCNSAIGAHLTNSFNAAGTGQTGSGMLTLMRPWWAKLREMGVQKIVALGAQTRGTTTDAWATEENQTIGVGWLAGGNVEQYYALLPAEISAGRINGFLNFQSWRGTDPNKWKTNGTAGLSTTDSTHPTGTVHLSEAAELRAYLAGQGMLSS